MCPLQPRLLSRFVYTVTPGVCGPTNRGCPDVRLGTLPRDRSLTELPRSAPPGPQPVEVTEGLVGVPQRGPFGPGL